MSWRRFNVLLRGLMGREDSVWARMVTAEVKARPAPRAGETVEEQTARLLKAFGVKEKEVSPA